MRALEILEEQLTAGKNQKTATSKTSKTSYETVDSLPSRHSTHPSRTHSTSNGSNKLSKNTQQTSAMATNPDLYDLYRHTAHHANTHTPTMKIKFTFRGEVKQTGVNHIEVEILTDPDGPSVINPEAAKVLQLSDKEIDKATEAVFRSIAIIE